MGEHKRSQQIFHVQVVTNLTLFKRRPVIVPAGGLTVLFNLTRCFLHFLQAKAAVVHPSVPQFSQNSYSLVIVILNSLIKKCT